MTETNIAVVTRTILLNVNFQNNAIQWNKVILEVETVNKIQI